MPARVTLRPPAASDEAAFVALVRRSRALHKPWMSPPSTPERFRAFLVRADSPNFVARLACRAEDGAIVGALNLSQLVFGNFRSAYLDYWVGAPFARQGYMTEALRRMVRLSFEDLGLHRLEANLQPGNDASRALVRRCGFRQEGFSPRYLKIGGRWRDHERWALTVEDWKKPSRR